MQTSNTQIYKNFRTAMLSKTDSWMDLISDDVSLIGPLAAVQGKDAFIQINKPFFASIQDNRVHKIIDIGGYVITQVSTDILLPDGSPLTLEVSEWYEMADGKIKSLKVYFDTHGLRG